MELRLNPAFFWPINSTIVRSLRFSVGLLRDRAVFRILWKISPNLAVDRATRLLLTPPRQAFSDAEMAALEEASLRPVPLTSGRLVAWRWGRAADPAVVLVHGWGGRGTQLRALIEPLLGRGFSVVTYDAPGHGMSGRGESSFPQFVLALNAVLDRFGPVHAIVGHSMGGAVAALAMAQRPSVSCAVLIAPPASLSDATRRVADALRWPEALRVAIQQRIERCFDVKWSEFEAEKASGGQPMLIVHDREDREVPLADGHRHQRNWPRARLLETRGLGHRRVLDDATVIRAVADFVAGERT